MARKRTAPKKDFIAYKNGWQLKIMPQTSRGWKHTAVWTLILLLPTVPYGALATLVDDTPNEPIALWALVPYFLILGLLMWWMFKWMLARSEIITMNDVVQGKRDKARKEER